jgi:hypothetical protein
MDEEEALRSDDEEDGFDSDVLGLSPGEPVLDCRLKLDSLRFSRLKFDSLLFDSFLSKISLLEISSRTDGFSSSIATNGVEGPKYKPDIFQQFQNGIL